MDSGASPSTRAWNYSEYREYTETQTTYRNVDTILDENPFDRYGYRFTGWNTEPDGTGIAYPAPLNYPDNGYISGRFSHDTTLYAQWQPIQLEVTFILTDDSAQFQGEQVTLYEEDGETYKRVRRFVDFNSSMDSDSFPSVHREGYSCTGWYTVDGIRITKSAKIINDMQLFAKWTAVEEETPTDPSQDVQILNGPPYMVIDPDVVGKFTPVGSSASFGGQKVYARFMSSTGGKSWSQGAGCSHYTTITPMSTWKCSDDGQMYYQVRILPGTTPMSRSNWSDNTNRGTRTYQPPWNDSVQWQFTGWQLYKEVNGTYIPSEDGVPVIFDNLYGAVREYYVPCKYLQSTYSVDGKCVSGYIFMAVDVPASQMP